MDGFAERSTVLKKTSETLQEVTTSYRKQKKNFIKGKIWLSFSDFQPTILASEFLTVSIQISM